MTIDNESVFLFSTTGTLGIVGFAVDKVVDNEDDCDKEETTTTTTATSTPFNKPDLCVECGDSGFYFKKRN